METKQAFANICERIWKQILSEEDLDPEIEASMRRVVAHLVVFAWNACNESKTLSEAKEKVVAFAKQVYGENDNAATPLLNAASIKWHDYKDDKTTIVCATVARINGKPEAFAHLEGELPAIESVTGGFRKYLESPEVQERLKSVPPEKLNEEIEKLAAEYSASLPPVDEEDNKAPEELFEFPIKREFLEETFQMSLWNIPLKEKTNMMKNIVKEHSFLAPLCKDYENCFKATEQLLEKGEKSRHPGSVPELILAIMGAYAHTVDFSDIDEDLLAECRDVSKEIIDSFLNQDEFFHETTTVFEESDLIEFICERVAALSLPKKELRKTLSALLAFGGAISTVREVNCPGNYEEEYDFDPDNLRVFQLRVELLGYDVVADVQVREDMTFEALHQFLNSLFMRDDDHLYRFECDDGLTAVCPVEDLDEYDDEDAASADVCYIGHHLSREDGAFYIFDYGEEWKHDIKVKKVLQENPDEHYPKVIKIKGDIPEQYPDYDGED